MTKTSLILAICSVLLISNQVNGQVEYVIDDGMSEAALGHGASGDFLWGNYFTEGVGGSVIETVSVAFGDGGVTPGTAFELAIYDDIDDDGDPSTGLVLLTNISGTVNTPSPVGMDAFQLIDVPNTMISGGFFVAAFVDGATNPLPALLDQTTSVQQSWFSQADPMAGDLDVVDPFGPTSTLSGLVDDFGNPGNWLIRCNGSCGFLLGDVNQDGFLDLLDVQPFVFVIVFGPYSCEADTNQDGIVDLLDAEPFVLLLTGT